MKISRLFVILSISSAYLLSSEANAKGQIQLPETPLQIEVKVKAQISSGDSEYSRITQLSNGNLAFGIGESFFIVSPEGAILKKSPELSGYGSASTELKDGTLFYVTAVGNGVGSVYFFNPDLTVKSVSPMNDNAFDLPAIALSDGGVVVASDQGGVFGYNNDGSLRFVRPIGASALGISLDAIYGNPDDVFVTGAEGPALGINTKTGNIAYWYYTGPPVNELNPTNVPLATPVLANTKGTDYFGTQSGQVVCTRMDSNSYLTFQPEFKGTISGLTMLSNQNAMFTVWNFTQSKSYFIDPSCKKIAEFDGESTNERPAVELSNGIVIVQGQNAQRQRALLFYDLQGNIAGKYSFDGNGFSGQVTELKDGSIATIDNSGRLLILALKLGS